MALMMGDLYIALKKAGADEESARAAAEEACSAYAGRPAVGSASAAPLPQSARQLTWMAAINLALTIVVFVLVVMIGR
jgi:cytochrome bd-type quinol oxidase subunit 2